MTDNMEPNMKHKHNIKIVHINIRSINSNFLLLDSETNIPTYDIIILTECWIQNYSIIPQLDGYNSVFTPTNQLKSGGIVMYIKNHLHFKEINVNLSYRACDYLIVNIPNLQLNIIGIYRHSSYYIQDFLKSLEEIISLKHLNGLNHDNIF